MFKKILAVVLSVLMLAGSTVMAAAQPVPEEPQSGISPRYSYVSNASVRLRISGGTARITGSVTGATSVTDIETTATLQIYDGGSWTDVDYWSDSTADNAIQISESSGSLDRGKYRVVLEFTVWANGDSESGSKTSSSVTY